MGADDRKLFKVPRDCMAGLVESWTQYPLPPGVTVTGNPSLLDIGANVGGFAMLACKIWDAREITCYEPEPEICAILTENLAGIPRVTIHRAAVGDPSRPFIYENDGSRLGNSQYAEGGKIIPCPVVHPETLPAADIIKLDVEGAEAYILSRLKHWPKILWVEWHSQSLRRAVDYIAGEAGLDQAYCRTLDPNTGISCYLKK